MATTKQHESKATYDYMVKILILGDSAVGKTSFLTRFSKGTETTSHIATIGFDLKTKTLEVEGKRIKLQIWDTAGQEKYRSIVQTYYKGAAGIILMYSVTDRKSFQNVENWMKQIKSDAVEGVVIVLIANKVDASEREVETAEGKRMADKYGLQFLEASAKEGLNVNESFLELAKQIKDKFGEASSDLLEKPALPQATAGGQKLQNTHETDPNTETDGNKGGCRC
mmetsp:Transcript_29321/g.33896  ORF Transcript_29321/g.33896 Transcript_29321/m.33896 type:complete len:225 (-) Transcript_29321:10-684(-)|eukprot:CAMPEP_0176425262 /NCGR_PEP_ID=MMETSP0127-20121128/11295_1 /TAXON_ID=938130 /ORGANISM="Platyophrya macrostoma, Strain WH" /LENGTH=224 /DNA_ID=CAMNT_0017806411 /DNA_START=27 /DNA_END=701 /DNA_ORIENTATION=+